MIHALDVVREKLAGWTRYRGANDRQALQPAAPVEGMNAAPTLSAASRWRRLPSCRAALRLVAVLAACIPAMQAAGAPAAEPARFAFSDSGGYERIVVTFDELPAYEVTANDGVLIIAFERPIDAGSSFKGIDKQKYLVAGRLDPDGKAVRFALTQKLSVNTIEAGNKLFIDLLPETWQGVAPGLPQEVIKDLAERARIAEEAARRQAALEEDLRKNRKVLVRIGENPTFTRLSFDWPTPPVAQISRSGKTVTIAFDQIATPVFGRLKADPPRFVDSANFSLDNDGLKVTLEIPSAMDVRAFREDNSYIVDIADAMGIGITGEAAERLAEKREDDQVGGTAVTRMHADRTGSGVASDVGSETRRETTVSPVVPEHEAAIPAPRAAAVPAVSTAVGPAESDVPTVVISERPLDHNGDPVAEVSVPSAARGSTGAPVLAARPAPKATTTVPSGLQNGSPPAATRAVAPAGPPVAANGVSVGPQAGGQPPPASAGPSSEGAPAADASGAVDGADPAPMRFSFSTPVSAAVFERAHALWIVFDSDEAPDLGQFDSPAVAAIFGQPRLLRSDDVQVIRVPLSDAVRFDARAHGNAWTVDFTAGDDTVKPVELNASALANGLLEVSADMASAREVHWLEDPVVGDRIAVVTTDGRPTLRGEAREFVEFASLGTAAGLAFKPYSDDLAIEISGGAVQVSRAEGLTLSAAGGTRAVTAAARSRTGPRRLVDFVEWSAGDPAAFLDKVERLEQGVAMLPEAQASGMRRELAQLYLANQLAAEALGQLELLASGDPDSAKRPRYFAMRGIARVMLYRPKQARPDLERRGVIDDPTITLWRAYLEFQSENWSKATDAFRKADEFIDNYPADLRVRFRLAAARAAIESGEWNLAGEQLEALPAHEIGRHGEADALVLRARLLESVGRVPEALVAYRKAMQSGDRHAEAEATYHHATLALRLGEITRLQAIDSYEAAAVMWRGDTLELEILRKLAELYIAEADHRRGLEIMKTAVVNFPRSPLKRDIRDEMDATFRTLFLEGGADEMSPIKALSLYYDFRELTPVGRLGDEMIRRLADRLIAVDLLDKAAEILAHQVDKRLTGAARAEVAARLASVYLMSRQPARALDVIRRTRQAVLPNALLVNRRLIEARALIEVGKARQAIDLLGDFDGPEVARVKADALWTSKQWQAAGEAYERILEPVASGESPLTENERIDVMRAAIAYCMAEDTFGLQRFRGKFAARMQDSPDAHAFAVLTQTVDRSTLQFRNLAKAVASIDTLDRFLEEFRKSLSTSGNRSPARTTGS